MTKITQEEIARRARVSRSCVSKILNDIPNYDASFETKEKVIKIAKELGYNLHEKRILSRRKYKRIEANIEVEIKIYIKGNNDIYDEGMAVVKDISPNGAYLSDIVLSKMNLPLTPFYMEVNIKEGELKGIKMLGEPVRLYVNGTINLGIRCQELMKHEAEKILAMSNSNNMFQNTGRGGMRNE